MSLITLQCDLHSRTALLPSLFCSYLSSLPQSLAIKQNKQTNGGRTTSRQTPNTKRGERRKARKKGGATPITDIRTQTNGGRSSVKTTSRGWPGRRLGDTFVKATGRALEPVYRHSLHMTHYTHYTSLITQMAS